MSIKINRYTPINSQGNTIGFCSFTFVKTGQFFNDCPVIRKNNGGFFVASPSRPYDGEDGVKRYSPYWGFETREMGDVFQKAVLEALYQKWREMKAESEKSAQTTQTTPEPQNAHQQPANEPEWGNAPDEGLPF